jgi:methionine-rich copper-binding protein CopC
MRTVFIVVVSTVRIIVRFGTFMARLTDINQRRNTIIQGLVIMAMAIEVIDSVSDWGSFASQSREPLQSCAAAWVTTKGIGMSRNTMAIGTLAVLAISLLATSANAHPKLNSVSPAADVSSKVSPTEIKLNFSEGVIAKLSGVEIKNESGKAIPTGVPVTDPKDQKQLVVPLPAPLSAGHYTVTWHAVSEDTHRVKGEYSFGVAH